MVSSIDFCSFAFLPRLLPFPAGDELVSALRFVPTGEDLCGEELGLDLSNAAMRAEDLRSDILNSPVDKLDV